MNSPSPSPPHNHSTEIFPIQSPDSISPEDELLVAYLDGELDESSKISLEAKLSSDPALRSRLEQLRSAWDLLDELPVTKPDPNFAQSTIEMVAMSAAELDGSRRSQTSASRWWLGAWLAIPLCMLIGYVAVRGWYRYQEHLAIEEVHLLADWEALKNVGSFEWLEKLTSVNDLARVSKRVSTSELGVGVVPQSTSQRRAWIASLSPTDRDRLSANLEDFKNFQQSRSAAELNKLIDLANRIYASENPESLLQVARSYSIFLVDMNATNRATHLDITDLDQRREDLQRRVNRKLVEVYSNELPADSPDKRAVADWKNTVFPSSAAFEETFQDPLQAQIHYGYALDELMQSLSPETREIYGRLNDKDLQQLALIWYLIKPREYRTALDRSQALDEFERRSPEEQAQLEFLPPTQVQDSLGVTRP